MPQVTVYIREDDLESWRAIEKKAEFLSSAIRGRVSSGEKPSVKQVLDNLSEDRMGNGLCKIHGLPLDSRGRCLQKGCKYA